MYIRFAFLIIVPGLLASIGCRVGDESTGQGLVQAPEKPPELTPAECEDRFLASHAEGLKLAGNRQYGLALRSFERAVALKPTSTEALFNLGACYEASGDPLRAINIYRTILRVTPDDPDCHFNLGTSYIKLYHREKSPVWRKMAREAWQRSLELNPEQAEARRFLVRTESLD